MNKWPKQNEAAKFYGDPRGTDGKANRNWEKNQLVMITPPFQMTYAGHDIKGLTIHRKCALSLMAVFTDIWHRSGKSQAMIDKWEVSIFGGSYNYRLKRNSNNLSMHAYGCAIDLSPASFPMHGDPAHTFVKPVMEAFAAEGWVNLVSDRMHFQAALL